MAKDYTKEWFLQEWGMGYQEYFTKERGYDYLQEITAVLNEHSNKSHAVLELGCGNGYWTKQLLAPRFNNVVAIDVIDKPKEFNGVENVNYICLPNSDYTCYGVKDESIDFVWSFGLFCHLTNTAVDEYLKNIYRVMKKNAKGLIMFANWERHPKLSSIYPILEHRNETPTDGWFYNDLITTVRQINESGLTFLKDTIPGFRDTLALFNKG